MEDGAEIRRLHRAEGLSTGEIARLTGVSRNTVRSAVRSETPPSYSRGRPGSVVDTVEPEIRKLLEEFPRMPATVIAERIDWQRGITVLKERVAELRPVVPTRRPPASAPSTGPASSPSGTCGSPPSMSPWPTTRWDVPRRRGGERLLEVDGRLHGALPGSP